MIPITDAANTYTSQNLWSFTGAAGYVTASTMTPFEGYWLYNLSTENVTLMVSPPGAVVKTAKKMPILKSGPDTEQPPLPPGAGIDNPKKRGGGCFLSL